MEIRGFGRIIDIEDSFDPDGEMFIQITLPDGDLCGDATLNRDSAKQLYLHLQKALGFCDWVSELEGRIKELQDVPNDYHTVTTRNENGEVLSNTRIVPLADY